MHEQLSVGVKDMDIVLTQINAFEWVYHMLNPPTSQEEWTRELVVASETMSKQDLVRLVIYWRNACLVAREEANVSEPD